YAGVVYQVLHLYKGKWRFASLPDLSNIVRASSVLAGLLFVLDYILVAPHVLRAFFFGQLPLPLLLFLPMFLLRGPPIAFHVFPRGRRMSSRYFRYSRPRQQAMAAESAPILVLGRAADAEVLLRAIESGAVKKIWPVGILSPSSADQSQSVRGVSVMGTPDRLAAVA